jgi:PEGA domain
MGPIEAPRIDALQIGRNLLWIFLCSAVLVPCAQAQAAAEAAGATAVSGGVAASTKPVQVPQPIPGQPNSPHVVRPATGDPVAANRKALESKAGTDGARLLLRSTPSPAEVWINNMPIGNTPLLLVLPPGKYTVEMRGSRQETGRTNLALLPKETRELALKLESRYPTRVQAPH